MYNLTGSLLTFAAGGCLMRRCWLGSGCAGGLQCPQGLTSWLVAPPGDPY